MASDEMDFEYAVKSVPPGALFVAADEPLLVYPSVAAAERGLEAIDVEAGIYPIAYGPDGEPYSIESERDRVVIRPTGEPKRPDDLRLLLLRYLEAIDRLPEATATYDELLAMAWGAKSDFWQEHDPYGDRFGSRIQTWGCAAVFIVLVVVLYFVFR